MLTANIFSNLLNVQRGFDELFNHVFQNESRLSAAPNRDVRWTPALECYIKDNQLVVRAFLPGVEQKNVSVSLTDNVLAIHGEHPAPEYLKNVRMLMSETPYGKFERRITLPPELLTDTDKCVARFENGVLEITTPIISQYMQKREIPIQSGADVKQIASA